MQNLNFKSVTFFYPSRIIGGAEFLFFRLAVYLMTKHQVKVSYIDYCDGVVRKMFEKEDIDVDFLEYKGFNKFKLNTETILITPLSSVFDIKMYFKGNFRIFFWSIHPSGLFHAIKSNYTYNSSNLPLTKAGTDLDFLIDKQGVYFMDETNLIYQKDIFNFKNTPNFFVPIFCGKRKEERKPVNPNEIHLGWVGRLSNDKIFSLVNIVDHSITFVADNPIQHIIIHVIGDGTERSRLEQIELPENVKIVFAGTLLEDSLTDYVNANFDLAFAMGTSALEMASMKKPVILVDFLYSALPKDNRFRWLYEAKNYNVVDKFDEILIRNVSFCELIKLVHNKEHYTEGQKCYNYYEHNHSINAVGNIITEGLSKSNLFFSDLKNVDFKVPLIIEKLRFAKRYLKSYL